MSARYKHVLLYLEDMSTHCGLCHRHDLKGEYLSAWLLAAETIFGQLPTRMPRNESWITGQSAVTVKPERTAYQRATLLKPSRHVYERAVGWEYLSCRHRVMAGEDNAKKRRCGECAKKQPEAASVVSRAHRGGSK